MARPSCEPPRGKCIANPCTHQRAEDNRRRKLKQSYGISIEQFDKMLEDQCGVCAICGSTPTGKDPVLHVDHCHTTKQVRGLLCTGCNQGLGRFDHDPELLEAAAKYLKEQL